MAIIKDRKAAASGMSLGVFALSIILLTYMTTAEAEVIHEEKFEKSLSSGGVSLMVIKNLTGDIRLSSWERPEVLVKAVRKVRAESDEQAQRYYSMFQTKVERIENRIEIGTENISGFMGDRLGSDAAIPLVEYNIYLPSDMNLDIQDTTGSVYTTGNRGKAKIQTSAGDIELRDVVGSVSAKTITGDIRAEILLDAESTFAATTGSVDILIGDQFSVPVFAETKTGSIIVTIPEGFSADVDAATSSGEVSCDPPLDGWIKKRSLRGGIFGGGPLLKLRAVSGDIAIRASEDGTEEVYEPAHIEAQSAEPVLPVLEREEPAKRPDVPRAEVVKTLSPPIIDGRLDDGCWKSAGRIEKLVWADGVGKPHEPTEAYLLWDDRNFYIGIKCYESSMDAIKISNTESDSEAWDDDMVQILIDTAPDTETGYYHIAINPIGIVFDQEIKSANVAERRIEESSLGVKWNSGGLFDTNISNDSWSVEAGIPLSAMKAEPQEGDIWRFNLYRTEQRRKEHTYWSPTYGQAEWPHVPDRFGELGFATMRLMAKTLRERPVFSEEALTIAGITVEGNDKVSQEEILEALGLKPGDLADVDILSRAKSRLESLNLFDNVSMDLTESDEGVNLVVGIMEKEIISPSEVQVRGATFFTEEQIIDYFNFGIARSTAEDVDIKCKLMERLYKVKGYEMAAVENSVISNTLIIDVDEGRIDRIQVRGNKRVRTRDIIKSLDLKPGMPYKRDEIDNAVYTMKARLPYFRWVNWAPGRSEDGLNMVYVDVKEADLIKANEYPVVKFDRVHGIQLGLGAELKSTYGMARGYSELSYGFSSKIWDYRFGMEKSWFRRHRSTIGIDVHRITDTNDAELVSDAEHFVAEAILGEAWRDFYQREGYELNFGQKFTPSTEFGLRYRDDDYTSLDKTNDWSVLNRSYTDEDWFEESQWTGSTNVHSRETYRVDGDEKYKPENPRIEEGRMRSLIAEYTIDTRNSEKDPASGWLNTFSVEYAGRGLGGKFDFNLYQVNIRRYNRLSGNQFFTFRVKAATADRELDLGLSDPHPRKFYLGGIGTLRGYPFKEFAGDTMVLINAEYWVMTNWSRRISGLGIVFFVDSGYAWPYDPERSIGDMVDDLKTNIGLGFQVGGLRVNLASPIREKDKDTVLSFRLARMF